VAEQSAKAVIFRFMFSLLSPLDMSPPASMFSLLLYADGNRRFNAKPPQASLTGFVQGKIQFDGYGSSIDKP
jgi:hypothetical protein